MARRGADTEEWNKVRMRTYCSISSYYTNQAAVDHKLSVSLIGLDDASDR